LSQARADFADDISRVHLEATGGREAQAALVGLRATGVTRINGKEFPFILYAARPRSIRIETLGESGTLVRVFDGVHAPWQKPDLMAPPSRLASAGESDFVTEAEFDDLLCDFRARGIELEDAGHAEVAGRSCLRLLATVRLTASYTLYVDEETLLVVRRDQRKTVRGRMAVVETYYSDFRPVAGVLQPFRIKVQSGDRVITETEISEVVANPEVPADFFAPPIAGWPKW
jgi:hypothetical protein